MCRGGYYPPSFCRKSPYTNEWDSKGTVFLWQSPEAAPLVGCGASLTSPSPLSLRDISPQIASKRFAKGELKKQSSGLFFKRGRLASEGVPLKMGLLTSRKLHSKCSFFINVWLFAQSCLNVIFKQIDGTVDTEA